MDDQQEVGVECFLISAAVIADFEVVFVEVVEGVGVGEVEAEDEEVSLFDSGNLLLSKQPEHQCVQLKMLTLLLLRQ
jgi:hypothetical protein